MLNILKEIQTNKNNKIKKQHEQNYKTIIVHVTKYTKTNKKKTILKWSKKKKKLLNIFLLLIIWEFINFLQKQKVKKQLEHAILSIFHIEYVYFQVFFSYGNAYIHM